MYNALVEILSEDELEDFQQNMLAELAEARPGLDGQEYKITKTALKQVQDLVSLGVFSSETSFLDILVYIIGNSSGTRWSGYDWGDRSP